MAHFSAQDDQDYQELQDDHEIGNYVEDALKLGVTPETLEVLMTCFPDSQRDELVNY